MKSLQNISYKTLFAILFFAIAGIVFFLKIGGKTSKVSAAWWDDMWHYRKAISISNTSGSNQNNIQIKILENYDVSALVTAGKLQSDLDDLRFTDINGNVIKYWIEDATNNSVDVWGLLTSVNTSATTIYMYYGNSLASSGVTKTGTADLPGISCKAIQLSGVTNDGIYYIDTDGLSPNNAYKTYCDMTQNGGGWTLLMKAEGTTTTFNYNANYWTTNNTLNIEDVDINNTNESKLESFNNLKINEIRATWPEIGHVMVQSVGLTTPLGLFQTTLDLGPSMSQFDYTNFPYQTGYQSYGFNLTCAPANRVRWGWMFNNETTCGSNDCSTGIGLMTMRNTSNGGYVNWGSNLPVGGYPYRVRLWGREDNIQVPDISFLNKSFESEELGTGPIAYWKFDEGSGTTAYDSAGTNNGTISGATYMSEDQCISGKCLSFDGISNGITTPDIIIPIIKPWTFSTWIKVPNSNTGWWSGIFGKRLGTDGGYWQFHGGGTLNFYQAVGYSLNTNINLGDEIPYNQWTHLTISSTPVNSTTSNLKIFINGINKYSANFTWSSSVFTFSQLGKGDNGRYFNGLMDEPKIYPYARTTDQIKLDYNAGKGRASSSQGTSVNLGAKDTSSVFMSNGLVGYWKMDENTGTSIADYSGNNNTGTLVGSGWSSGKYGIGVSFDGIDDYIDLGNPSLSSLTNTTISFWRKAINSNAWLLFKGQNNGYYAMATNGTGNFYHAQIGASTQIYVDGNLSNTPLTDNNWHHYVITGANLSTWTNLSISNYTNFHYNGLIDEVRIYNRSLSPTEVTQLYNYTPDQNNLKSSLIAHWKFDENNSTTAYDSSGNNNNGTLSGQIIPTWETNGKINKSLYFYGIGTNTRGYVTTNPINTGNNGTLTFSFWIKPDSSQTGSGWIARNGIGSDENYGIKIGSPSFGKYKLSIERHTTTFITANGSDYLIPASEWSYITIILTDDSNWKYYINGKYVETISISGVASNSTSILSIGGHSGTNGQYFNGLLDEFKIYNRALTEDEIKQDYNAGSAIQFGTTTQTIGATTTSLEYCIPGDTSYCASPIAEYKMDEGAGTTAFDTSGNNNTGTITGATWSQGKIGKALNFTGSNSYVNIGTSLNSNFTSQNYTIESWINPARLNGSDVTNYEIFGNESYQNYGILFRMNIHGTPGSLSFRTNQTGTAQFTSSNLITIANVWYHVAAVRNGSSVRIYINGIDQTSSAGNHIDATLSPSSSKISGSSQSFNGKLDGVKIYNYARTPAQIAYDYNKGGPVGWWKFDECQGNTAYDWSSNANHGTINIGTSGSQNSLGTCATGTSAAWKNGEIGKINSSLNFDGVDDYVDLTGFTNSGTTHTIALWINSKSNSSSKYFFDVENGRILLGWGSDTAGQIGLFDGTWRLFGNSPSINNWHHLVFVLDSSINKTKMYLNGIQYGNQLDYAPNQITGIIHLGSRHSLLSSWYGFNGQIDDVRIYNYALTEEQVKQVYNGGAVNFR